MRNFDYIDIKVKREHGGDRLAVVGEITNRSGRNYQSVTFRVVAFAKNQAIANVVVTMNGFLNNQTRGFEKTLGDLIYSQTANLVTGVEIAMESAY